MRPSKPLLAMGVLFAGMMLIGFGCASRKALPTVRTIVVNDMHGRPMADAKVFVQGRGLLTETATGPDGIVRVEGLGRPMHVIVSYPGYQSFTGAFRAHANPVRIVLKEDY